MDVKVNKNDVDNIKRFAILLASKKFTFVVGLHEYKDKTEEVHIKNLDETESVKIMTLEEILYFIDKGTISTPAKHIMDEIEKEISKYYEFNFPLWLDESLKYERADDGVNYLTGKVYMFNEYINNIIIPQVIDKIKSSSSYVNGIIGKDEDNTWFYDINRIKGYIKSRIEII